VLEIPAGVRDGTVLRQSLPEMPGAFLQIVVRISGS
jgi:hypothetical protein